MQCILCIANALLVKTQSKTPDQKCICDVFPTGDIELLQTLFWTKIGPHLSPAPIFHKYENWKIHNFTYTTQKVLVSTVFPKYDLISFYFEIILF